MVVIGANGAPAIGAPAIGTIGGTSGGGTIGGTSGGGSHLRRASVAEGLNSAKSVNEGEGIFQPERTSVKRIVYPIVAASAAVVVVSGCSASEIVNTGGDTKCKDFLTQDEQKQNDEVSKMLKDKSGADPTNLEITATKTSVTLYCQALGKEDTKISEAPHG